MLWIYFVWMFVYRFKFKKKKRNCSYFDVSLWIEIVSFEKVFIAYGYIEYISVSLYKIIVIIKK